MTTAAIEHRTNRERARSLDRLLIGAKVALAEKPAYHIQWGIEKWSEAQTAEATRLLHGLVPQAEDFHRLGFKPKTELLEKNLLTTAGLTRLVANLNAQNLNGVTTTTARIGVGNGAGTAAVGDTDLSASAGSTNRWFMTCTVSASGAVLTLTCTFASGDGNFAWNEFGIDVGTATVTAGATVNALLLNHKTSIAQGTKASGQSWAVTATITFS